MSLTLTLPARRRLFTRTIANITELDEGAAIASARTLFDTWIERDPKCALESVRLIFRNTGMPVQEFEVVVKRGRDCVQHGDGGRAVVETDRRGKKGYEGRLILEEGFDPWGSNYSDFY